MHLWLLAAPGASLAADAQRSDHRCVVEIARFRRERVG